MRLQVTSGEVTAAGTRSGVKNDTAAVGRGTLASHLQLFLCAQFLLVLNPGYFHAVLC